MKKNLLLFFSVFFVSQSNGMLQELPGLTQFCCARLTDCVRNVHDYVEQKQYDCFVDQRKEDESCCEFYCRSEMIAKSLAYCFGGGCFGVITSLLAATICKKTGAWNFALENNLNSTVSLCTFLKEMGEI